jgi:hypothetical protein
MAFKVQASFADPGDPTLYLQGFRDQIETHLNILKFTNPQSHYVQPDALWQFEGNLYGYLASIGQSHDIHWIIMRMNGMHNPHEFGRKPLERATPTPGMTLLFPDASLVSNIRTLYLSKKEV